MSRKLITYPFHLLFFLHFSLKILTLPMGMSACFASTEEKIAVQNLGTLFISYSITMISWLLTNLLCKLHNLAKPLPYRSGVRRQVWGFSDTWEKILIFDLTSDIWFWNVLKVFFATKTQEITWKKLSTRNILLLKLGRRKNITYSFYLLFFLYASLKILAILLGMSAFLASSKEELTS